jgi:hypothetical protein
MQSKPGIRGNRSQKFSVIESHLLWTDNRNQTITKRQIDLVVAFDAFRADNMLEIPRNNRIRACHGSRGDMLAISQPTLPEDSGPQIGMSKIVHFINGITFKD